MKRILVFCVLAIILSLNLSGYDSFPISDTNLNPCTKILTTKKNKNYFFVEKNSEIAPTFIPLIHNGIWPDFCIHHLQEDPEGCSDWTSYDRLQPQFFLNGSSSCHIDANLVHRIGRDIYLIPENSSGRHGYCNHAVCSQCFQRVLHAVCYEENEYAENDDDYWICYIAYQCACTGGMWLDLNDLEIKDSEICRKWNFCNKPTIYHGYFDWHHQSYFHNLEYYISYLKRNPSCCCYWPQSSNQSKAISDLAYSKLFDMLDRSCVDLHENFTSYLVNRTYYGFLSGLLTHAFFYSDYLNILSDFDRHCFKISPSDYSENHLDLVSIVESLQKPFLDIYNQCIAKHPHPKIYYERGVILFQNGENLDALDDIRHFIAYVEKNEYQLFLTSDLYLKEGTLLSEVLAYDEAIISLTKAIKKNPENADAYFERAFAYFETGQFDKALSDYLKTGKAPKKINPNNEHYLSLSKGIALGMLKGGQESATTFIPSLLASVHGIGSGLWAFISKPIPISEEIIRSTYACFEFVIYNSPKEIISFLAPEIQECLSKWHRLDPLTKGHYIGHVIGKYGIDIFAGTGCVKSIRLFRNLRKANAIMTLETAATSPKAAQEVFALGLEKKIIRDKILKGDNLKIQWDKQGKHVIGHKNYMPEKNKSIFIHTNPEQLINKFAGTGIKTSKVNPGTPGYNEIINFKEYIGYFVNQETGEKISTTWGKIHYAKDGLHIVPTLPRNGG